MADAGSTATGVGADFVAGSTMVPVDGVPGRFAGEVADDWRIFYAFGGMTLALGARAAVAAVDRPDLRLVTVGAQYIRPVPVGPVTAQVDVVRQGRGASQAAVDLYVGDDADPGQLALRLQTTFGAPHDPHMSFDGATFPDGAKSPHDWSPPPPHPAGDPFADIPFHRQTDWRPCADDVDRWADPSYTVPPGDAVANSWTRLLTDPITDDGGFDPLALLLYSDAIGGAFGSALGSEAGDWFVLTLNLDVRLFQRPSSPWVLQHQRGWRAVDGYGTGWTELWGEDHQLLAVATQTASMKPMATPPSV